MTAKPESPYKGLNAFEDSELDALLFFGREREREIVVANLIASRLTVLYGPSGVGKSSLLRAAVARSLRELPEEPLVVVFSRWSEDPSAALAEALAEAAGVGPNGSAITALEQAQADRDVYLVLDQAEEYFLYHADDSGPGSFAEALPTVLATPLRVNVLVSLREDSLAKLDRFTGRIPGLFANTLRLDRLDRQAAQAAIERPIERFAELTGVAVTVEPALVERVLGEVGAGQIEPALGGLGAVEGVDGGARIEAPYLQLVMQRLWDEERASGSSVLRVETLERLGGAQHIVEEHLEGAMAELHTGTEGRRRSALQPPRHSLRNEDRARDHRPQRLRQHLTREASPGARDARRAAHPPNRRGRRDVRYEIFHDVLAQPVLAWRARHRTEREVERHLVDEQRRRSRFHRLLALTAAAVAIVAVIAGFALVQRSNANEQSREAQARRLDASAIRLLEEDPELSLLLASESARSAPAPTAEDALRRSLLTSHVRDVFTTDGPITELEFAPDGRQVGFVSEDGSARLVDASTGEEIAVRTVGSNGGVSFGSVLVHGSSGPARVVDPATGEPRCSVGRAPVADAVVAGRFVVAVRNGIGAVSDASSCRLVRSIGRVGQTAVRLVASPDGRRVAFLSGREARIADPRTGRVLYRLLHPGEITSLAFSGDARLVVTGGRDQLARIWSGLNGRRIRQLEGHDGQVLDVAITASGTEVATASTDGTARIWSVSSGLLEALLFGHTRFVRTVDFSPNGLSVVTASDDGTARTWALNGRRLTTLAGHTGTMHRCALFT